MTAPKINDGLVAELEALCKNCLPENCADEEEQSRNETEFLLDVDSSTILDLLVERRKLIAQREAILQQARIWACEAKTQQGITEEVGAILGGIPNWGPIAERVTDLKRDAERYRVLRERAVQDVDGYLSETPVIVYANNYSDDWRERIDAAVDSAKQEQTP